MRRMCSPGLVFLCLLHTMLVHTSVICSVSVNQRIFMRRFHIDPYVNLGLYVGLFRVAIWEIVRVQGVDQL